MQPVIKKIRSALFLNPHPTGKLQVTLSGVDKIYQVVKVLLNQAVIPSNLGSHAQFISPHIPIS
jgi:hypothetical protein